ncbi:MAG TPA: MMPL family transporter, partial [Candidatus Thermoplasmatota archaeon]|nr:MMPL family transporter [Candidatus Thermoplasmatota archaeon]
MPNKWVGRVSATVLALLAGVVGWFIGVWIGDKLAYGFTFDWYVHPVHASYGLEEVLPHVASTGAFAALLSTTIGVFSTAFVTRLLMRKMRYTPPQYSRPVSTDVHFGRLAAAALFLAPLLATLLAYVALASPLFEATLRGGRGAVIENVSPDGFVLLMGATSAFFSFLATLIANLSTEAGVVSGRIVAKSDRNLIARASIFGMRNAKTTIALIIGITVVAGASASTITTNVDVADVLPRGDPNTEAAHNLTTAFKSSFTQQVTFQFRVIEINNSTQRDLFDRENREKLPNRVTDTSALSSEVGRPENITDELYVRAMAEVIDFVLTQEPFEGSVGSPDIFKLVNWTLAGGRNASDSAFAIPGQRGTPTLEDEMRYASVEAGVFAAPPLASAVDAVTSPTWRQTAVLFTVGPEYNGSTKHIGERALQVRDMWLEKVARGETQYDIFGPANPPQFSVDLPIANAHASALTEHDFKILLPVIALFIAMTLFIAFRNAVSVVATFAMLAIAVTWTFGVMGAMKIPLNTINLATVPLIMGIGIDYGIHLMNEYQELRHQGRTPEQAWVAAGGGSSLALFIALITTLTGLFVMVVSPSLLVAQLGVLSIVALISCYVLAVVFIPAMVTLLGDRGRKRHVEYQPSRLMPMLATGISRGRWAVALVLVLLAGAAIASASGIHREAFGDPPRNWLEDDPLRQEHARAIEGFYDRADDAVKANVLIIEGDITDPAVHAYINALTGTLRAQATGGWRDPDANNQIRDSRVIADTLRDLPFLLNTYLTVRDGAPGAAQFLGAGALNELFRQGNLEPGAQATETYPRSREQMKALMDEVMASPLYQFGNLFVNAPEFDMTIIVFSVEAASYEDAADVWREVHVAIAANDHLRPDGTQVSFFGNTAINYLFVAKQVP